MAEDQTDKTQVSRRAAEEYGTLRPGALIGRYEIVSVLGQGSFGITYRARDTQLDRDVAIKEYLPSALAVRHEGTTVLPRSARMVDDFMWARAGFLDEARIMARFAHAPAIVRVHDFLEAHGTAYMVMPLLEGETLEARLKREGRLHQPAIERILYPLLDGLEQIHAASFLHRDIKPANIIVAADGSPTLIDFGASREALQERTQAITAVFTPRYAPLEQFASGRQGPWTDIYALAATLYACIDGKPPPSAVDRASGIAIMPAAEVGKREYASRLLTAIDAGLALKSEERPQTIDEWRKILATGVSTGPTKAADGDPARWGARPLLVAPSLPVAAARRRPVTLWFGAGVALVLAGTGTYWTTFLREAPRPPAEVAARQQQASAGADAQKQAAEAEKAKATTKALDDLRRAAERDETSLRLGDKDRQKIQVALTSLGFTTGGSDGALGPRSRQMIAAWQQRSGAPATGFISAAQRDDLFRSAAPAIARWEEEQRKLDDEKKRADEAAAVPATAAGKYFWVGHAGCAIWSAKIGAMPLRIEMNDGQGSQHAIWGSGSVALDIAIRGDQAGGKFEWVSVIDSREWTGKFAGSASGDQILLQTVSRPKTRSTVSAIDDTLCQVELHRVPG